MNSVPFIIQQPIFGTYLLLFFVLFSCKSDTKEIPNPFDKKQIGLKLKTEKKDSSIAEQALLSDSISDNQLQVDSSNHEGVQGIVVEDKKDLSKNDAKKLELSSDVKEKPKKKKPRKINKLKPQIEFDKIRFDFDTITEGDTIKYNFKFRNEGKAPLVIESATATCGCTVPSYPFIPIEPGEEGFIGVRYISVGKQGLQKPLITIHSNAKKEPITLQLKGYVKQKDKLEKE